MTAVSEMLRTHPQGLLSEDLSYCIDACFDCYETCISCADACLAEEDVGQLKRCIRLNLDCADVCNATAKMLTRRNHFDLAFARPQIEACIAICSSCAEECSRHAGMHEHCRVCADACRRCEQACRQFLS
jgi:hypothetical protein